MTRRIQNLQYITLKNRKEVINMQYSIPDPNIQKWVFDAKKALSYRIWVDPQVTSDLIQYLYDNLTEEFHNQVTYFQFNDIDKSFVIKLMENVNMNYEPGLQQAIDKSIWRICCAYKTSIESAIYEIGGTEARNTFNDAMEHNRVKLLSQIVTISYYPISENNLIGYCFTIRLY